MIDIQKMAEENKILEIKTGSFLYGLETKNSDLDYGGIFLPNKEFVYGFEKCDEVDLSIISKLKNNKNSKDAIDRKLYEFRKFVTLAIKNNPNILEYLFVNEKNIVFINEYGKELLKMAEYFPHRGLKNKFVNYAISQKKKMIIKKENYIDLENGEKLLDKFINSGKEKLLLPQCESDLKFKELFRIKKSTDNHYRIGDMMLVKNQTVKRAKQEIQKRIGEKTNRKELIKDKGYDYKFGSHLIRLLIEGKELLETGRLVFPLKNKKDIFEIKKGLWTLEDVLNYSNQLESEIEVIENNSVLPSKARYDMIQNFLIEILEDWLGNSKK